MSFHPYLFFGGNCREAFTRYQEIFGGNLELMRVGDVPDQAGLDKGAKVLLRFGYRFPPFLYPRP